MKCPLFGAAIIISGARLDQPRQLAAQARASFHPVLDGLRKNLGSAPDGQALSATRDGGVNQFAAEDGGKPRREEQKDFIELRPLTFMDGQSVHEIMRGETQR